MQGKYNQVWDEIVNSLISGMVQNDTLLIEELITKYQLQKEPNAPYFLRIRELYEILPPDSLKSTKRMTSEISGALNSILYNRQITIENLNEIIKRQSSCNKNSSKVNLEKLSASVETLKAEAARLSALTQELKIKYKN